MLLLCFFHYDKLCKIKESKFNSPYVIRVVGHIKEFSAKVIHGKNNIGILNIGYNYVGQ